MVVFMMAAFRVGNGASPGKKMVTAIKNYVADNLTY